MEKREQTVSSSSYFFLSFKFILKKSHGNSCNLFESLVVSLCHEKILCISLHTHREEGKLWIEIPEEAHKVERAQKKIQNKNFTKLRERKMYKNWLNRHLSCGLAF